MSFLYALIKHPNRFSSRLDNFPFFLFRFLEVESPLLEFGRIVPEEPCDAAWAGNGRGYGDAGRNIFYFQGLRTKYVLRMHACIAARGTTDWKIVVASWRILTRGYPGSEATSNRVEDHWKLVAVSQACERPFR